MSNYLQWSSGLGPNKVEVYSEMSVLTNYKMLYEIRLNGKSVDLYDLTKSLPNGNVWYDRAKNKELRDMFDMDYMGRYFKTYETALEIAQDIAYELGETGHIETYASKTAMVDASMLGEFLEMGDGESAYSLVSEVARFNSEYSFLANMTSNEAFGFVFANFDNFIEDALHLYETNTDFRSKANWILEIDDTASKSASVEFTPAQLAIIEDAAKLALRIDYYAEIESHNFLPADMVEDIYMFTFANNWEGDTGWTGYLHYEDDEADENSQPFNAPTPVECIQKMVDFCLNNRIAKKAQSMVKADTLVAGDIIVCQGTDDDELIVINTNKTYHVDCAFITGYSAGGMYSPHKDSMVTLVRHVNLF